MKKCWDVDPSKRPTIGELLDFAYDFLLTKVYIVEDSSNDEIIIPTTSNSNNRNNNDNSLQEIQKSHLLACHSSRILDDDIARYKSFEFEGKCKLSYHLLII